MYVYSKYDTLYSLTVDETWCYNVTLENIYLDKSFCSQTHYNDSISKLRVVEH